MRRDAPPQRASGTVTIRRVSRLRAAILLALLAAAPSLADDKDTPPMHEHTNRLAKESSPYLLQHAHNPVDWYPWGDEAFAKAKKEDKPVFLSIGYSTCHWCHVMERESFEKDDVAKALAADFVAIKVDREERPDVDAVYMAAVQAMAGQGGWPLSVFLTPDGKPFFGGTYFPPEDRFGRPGFKTVLARIAAYWKEHRKDVDASADELTSHLQGSEAPAKGELSADALVRGVEQFRGSFDSVHGGFGGAPKFPRAFALSFLLGQRRRVPAATVVPLVEKTLDEMARGGMCDQIGGGFHRYSTDAEWLVPHFEKMLYDQATLARAYVEAWQATGNAVFASTARDTLDYVLRDLADPAGGFHSAEDADSEGVEGKFYVWTRAEIVAALGEEDGALFADLYGATDAGNYRDEATHRATGANILHLETSVAVEAKKMGVAPDELERRVAPLREKLLAIRSKRIRPHLDDKVLTDWNGLMIGTLAHAGAALGEKRYVDAAARAAEFLLSTMRTKSGLLHRYRKGAAGIDGFLDDYAFLALGLADLYEATFDPKRLAAARDLARQIVARFADGKGAFVLSSSSGETLVARTKELYDGAIPSGNSAAMFALLRIGRMTQDEALEKAGRDALASWAGTIARYPSGYPVALQALSFAIGPTREVVIAGDPADAATQALVAEVRRRHLPDTVVLLHPPGDAGRAIEAIAPFVKGEGLVGGKPAAYVCSNFACKAPVTTAADLARLLDE
jgi:uncharacterized protein YyaL (SSP411 family)